MKSSASADTSGIMDFLPGCENMFWDMTSHEIQSVSMERLHPIATLAAWPQSPTISPLTRSVSRDGVGLFSLRLDAVCQRHQVRAPDSHDHFLHVTAAAVFEPSSRAGK